MNKLSLAVQYAADEDEPPSRPRVRALVRAAMRGARRDGDITVRFVGAAEMTALNRRYRRRERAANVLSFAYDGGGGAVFGDIAVCCGVAGAEAARFGMRRGDRIAHLIVHGVLHLLGHRHDTPAAARQMEDAERRVLTNFGIADPYRAAPAAKGAAA